MLLAWRCNNGTLSHCSVCWTFYFAKAEFASAHCFKCCTGRTATALGQICLHSPERKKTKQQLLPGRQQPLFQCAFVPGSYAFHICLILCECHFPLSSVLNCSVPLKSTFPVSITKAPRKEEEGLLDPLTTSSHKMSHASLWHLMMKWWTWDIAWSSNSCFLGPKSRKPWKPLRPVVRNVTGSQARLSTQSTTHFVLGEKISIDFKTQPLGSQPVKGVVGGGRCLFWA